MLTIPLVISLTRERAEIDLKAMKYKRSDEALALLGVLNEYSKSDKIMFGHQNAGHIGVGISKRDGTESDVKNICGRQPAVVGVDTLSFLGYEGNMTDLIKTVKNLHRQGCIITLSSHMPNFALGGDGFYDYSPNITEGDCAHRIMEGGDLNAKYLRFLDMIADFVSKCVDIEGNPIPMIFRPFHESNGSWFWWGEEYLADRHYIELFRYTTDYLMEKKNLDNLLICYSPNGKIDSKDQYMERYPGDDVVDIMGVDYYHDHPHKGDGFASSLTKTLDNVAACAKEHSKLCALTETGYRTFDDSGSYYEGLAPEGNLIKTWFTDMLNIIMSSAGGRSMAYMLCWANFSDVQFWVPYVKDGFRHEMTDDFEAFINDDRVVTAPVFMRTTDV